MSFKGDKNEKKKKEPVSVPNTQQSPRSFNEQSASNGRNFSFRYRYLACNVPEELKDSPNVENQPELGYSPYDVLLWTDPDHPPLFMTEKPEYIIPQRRVRSEVTPAANDMTALQSALHLQGKRDNKRSDYYDSTFVSKTIGAQETNHKQLAAFSEYHTSSEQMQPMKQEIYSQPSYLAALSAQESYKRGVPVTKENTLMNKALEHFMSARFQTTREFYSPSRSREYSPADLNAAASPEFASQQESLLRAILQVKSPEADEVCSQQQHYSPVSTSVYTSKQHYANATAISQQQNCLPKTSKSLYHQQYKAAYVSQKTINVDVPTSTTYQYPQQLFTLTPEEFPALPGASAHLSANPCKPSYAHSSSLPACGEDITKEISSKFSLSSPEDFPALPKENNNTSQKSNTDPRPVESPATEKRPHHIIFDKNNVSKLSNIPDSMLTDQYGIAGLIQIMKLPQSSDLLLLNTGINLSENLGLDLRSSPPLLTNFRGPFAEATQGMQDLTFQLPEGYHVSKRAKNRLPLPVFSNFPEDKLFFLFYFCLGDLLQLLASRELFERGWRFHIEQHQWLKLENKPKAETEDFIKGEFRFFDAIKWQYTMVTTIVEKSRLEQQPPKLPVPLNWPPSDFQSNTATL